MEGLKVVGRKEKVNFPAIELERLEAKIDTGAYTSSIHCDSIQNLGDNKVSCVFLYPEHELYSGKAFLFDIEKVVDVKSSNGETEERYMIKTRIEICGEAHEIYLTLTDRSEMKTQVLIGRRFLSNKFLVNVAKRKNIKNSSE